jgi:hypothetical protein
MCILNFELSKERYRFLILSEHLNTDFSSSSKKEGHELRAIPVKCKIYRKRRSRLVRRQYATGEAAIRSDSSPTRHATRYCAFRGRDAAPEQARARRGCDLDAVLCKRAERAGWVWRLRCPGDRMRQGLSVDAVPLTASERGLCGPGEQVTSGGHALHIQTSSIRFRWLRANTAAEMYRDGGGNKI